MTKSQVAVSIAPAMTNNVNVGMDEVVSVFVAKYENGLFDKKDKLAAAIRSAKTKLAGFDGAAKASVDVSKYTGSVPVLGLKFEPRSELSVQWKTGSYNEQGINMQVRMTTMDGEHEHTQHITLPLPAALLKQYEAVVAEIDQASVELTDVITLIKQVGRKERQVRGRIAEMKLAESGLSELLNNAEMLQLIEVK